MPERERIPRRLWVAGAIAGLIAGTVMSMGMMLFAILGNESIWAMPNLIGAMWFGGMSDGPGLQAAAGFLTHELTSVIMGVVAVPFVHGLSTRRVLLISMAYALASYPFVFTLVLSWANRLMFERARMPEETWAHLLFGAVFAFSFLRLARRAHEGE